MLFMLILLGLFVVGITTGAIIYNNYQKSLLKKKQPSKQTPVKPILTNQSSAIQLPIINSTCIDRTLWGGELLFKTVLNKCYYINKNDQITLFGSTGVIRSLLKDDTDKNVELDIDSEYIKKVDSEEENRIMYRYLVATSVEPNITNLYILKYNRDIFNFNQVNSVLDEIDLGTYDKNTPIDASKFISRELIDYPWGYNL